MFLCSMFVSAPCVEFLRVKLIPKVTLESFQSNMVPSLEVLLVRSYRSTKYFQILIYDLGRRWEFINFVQRVNFSNNRHNSFSTAKQKILKNLRKKNTRMRKKHHITHCGLSKIVCVTTVALFYEIQWCCKVAPKFKSQRWDERFT